MMRRTALLLFVAAFAVLGATCHSSGRVFYTGVYISLGDSIAAGNGASDPATTSFVALLDRDEGGLPLINLAKAGDE